MGPARRGPVAPFQLGDFVVCNFPYDDAPDQPGPKEHFGLCLGTLASSAGQVAAVAAYTTSQAWPTGMPVPRGVHRVSQAAAVAMGQQRAFVVDARKIAFMPITEEFFPQLRERG